MVRRTCGPVVRSVPGGFEFDALRLHAAAVEQVGQIDRENRAHGGTTLVHGLLSGIRHSTVKNMRLPDFTYSVPVADGT